MKLLNTGGWGDISIAPKKSHASAPSKAVVGLVYKTENSKYSHNSHYSKPCSLYTKLKIQNIITGRIVRKFTQFKQFTQLKQFRKLKTGIHTTILKHPSSWTKSHCIHYSTEGLHTLTYCMMKVSDYWNLLLCNRLHLAQSSCLTILNSKSCNFHLTA